MSNAQVTETPQLYSSLTAEQPATAASAAKIAPGPHVHMLTSCCGAGRWAAVQLYMVMTSKYSNCSLQPYACLSLSCYKVAKSAA